MNTIIPWQAMKPDTMFESTGRSEIVKPILLIHVTPITITSEMTTFNQCLHDGNHYVSVPHSIHTLPCLFWISFLVSLDVCTLWLESWLGTQHWPVIHNQAWNKIIIDTCIHVYTYHRDEDDRSNECPNEISVVSQPTPTVTCTFIIAP